MQKVVMTAVEIDYLPPRFQELNLVIHVTFSRRETVLCHRRDLVLFAKLCASFHVKIAKI